MAYGNYYGMNGYPAGYFNPTGAVPDALNQYKMPYQPQMPQQMQAQAQPSQNNSGMIWVQGEAGAKSYLVAPGNTVLLMDSENCTFYLKTSDANGMPSMKTFDYSERPQPQAKPLQPTQNTFDMGNYVTHKELEEKLAQISASVTQKNISEKKGKENGEDV